MKLNKYICIRCIKKYNRWTNSDDIRWNNGFVICSSRVTVVNQSTDTDNIPDHCSYKLEHIMEEQ